MVFLFCQFIYAEGLEQGVKKTVRRTVLARRVYDTFNYDTRRDKRGESYRKMKIFCPCQNKTTVLIQYRSLFVFIRCFVRY